MPWIDAFVELECHQRDVVVSDTWGHLAPKLKKIYKGCILFTCGCYGDYTVIKSDFPASPWYYNHEQDFVCKHAKKKGKVYLFEGTYEMLTADASQHRFVGKVKRLRL